MQIKATVRYYSIPVRIPKIKIQTIASADKDVEQLGLTRYWQNVKWHGYSGKQLGGFS